jgi:hypothetical protein
MRLNLGACGAARQPGRKTPQPVLWCSKAAWQEDTPACPVLAVCFPPPPTLRAVYSRKLGVEARSHQSLAVLARAAVVHAQQ